MTTQTAIGLKRISADTHVVEPADLWTRRIEPRFRGREPRVESRPDGDYKFERIRGSLNSALER